MIHYSILFFVALGGALGASARYLTATAIGQWLGTEFPYATLIINITGALLIGLLMEMMALRWSVSQELRAFLVVGILGGFTTFSAYSLEVILLAQRGELIQAVFYALFSVAACLVAVIIGIHCARLVL